MSAPTALFGLLIVDDEPLILQSCRRVLCALNEVERDESDFAALEAELFGAVGVAEPSACFEVVQCRQGEEAVAAATQAKDEGRPFAVAFVDVRMPPGIDGVETAARLRAIDPDLNLVIVTAYADRTPRTIARLVPPLDKLYYIAKPFQPAELQQFALALTAKWRAEISLRHAYADLDGKYHELAHAHQDLLVAKQQAERASQEKISFFAGVGHELRTPLNIVLGFADIMRMEQFGPIGNAKYREYIDDIHHSGAHLLRVINDLLDFSKVEASKLELLVAEVDAAEIVESVVTLMREQAAHAGVELVWQPPGSPVRFVADSDRVRQILFNLLSNAVKFTPEGGTVTVTAESEPKGGVVFTVADTGIGIDPASISRVMQPFEQARSEPAHKHQGTGLGLPLSKRLAELHGGALTLESLPGQGTVATVRFPARAAAIRAA